MNRDELRLRIGASRFARAAALPPRLGAVARFNGKNLAESARWLATSREHTNYTYDLTDLNLEHLSWFVARVSGRPIADAKDALSEIALDSRLVHQLQVAVRSSPRRGLMDQSVRLGRRMGWYALVRLLEPQHVVETGTDKGLGTCVLAAAVLRNGRGSVTTIDINPASGSLIVEPYGSVVDRRIGDSIEILASLADVDFFIHDSDHSASYESRELAAVTPTLTARATVLSDNSDATNVLATWAAEHGRVFDFFAEDPSRHWFPGGGIGAAVASAKG